MMIDTPLSPPQINFKAVAGLVEPASAPKMHHMSPNSPLVASAAGEDNSEGQGEDSSPMARAGSPPEMQARGVDRFSAMISRIERMAAGGQVPSTCSFFAQAD